jgi:hypothetical protein
VLKVIQSAILTEIISHNKNVFMMKKLRNTFLLLALSLMIFSPAMAQSAGDGSEVIGRWNLTVVIEGKELAELGLFRHGLMASEGFPGWLEVKKSGFSTLIGYYVGYEGSARPISRGTIFDAAGKKYISPSRHNG